MISKFSRGMPERATNFCTTFCVCGCRLNFRRDQIDLNVRDENLVIVSKRFCVTCTYFRAECMESDSEFKSRGANFQVY